MNEHVEPVSALPAMEPLVDASRASGVHSPRVLAAMGTVDRRQFVPLGYHESALEDAPVPIPCHQVTTQPSLVARMVQALALEGHERVLEVGTGLGYQAAVLSKLCDEVVTVEWFEELAEQAVRNLAAAGIRNVRVLVGDGALGYPLHAPYGGIILAAAAREVPPQLIEQLEEGSRLVQPVGPGGAEVVTAFRKHHGRLEKISPVVGAYFVPLLGRYGPRGGAAPQGGHSSDRGLHP